MYQTLQSRHPFTTLPPFLILLALAFSFSIVSITNSKWVRSPYLSGDPIGDTVLWNSRGPFGQCNVYTGGDGPTSTCEARRTCDQGGAFTDPAYVCQQVDFWAGWLVTGAVFAGLSMLCGWGLGVWLVLRRVWKEEREGDEIGIVEEERRAEGEWETEADRVERERAEEGREKGREEGGDAERSQRADNAALKEGRHPHNHHQQEHGDRQHWQRRETFFRRLEKGISFWTATFASLSVLFLAVGTFFLLQLLTNNVRWDGDSITHGAADCETTNYAHWTWKTPGVAYAFLSWLFDVVALVMLVPLAFLDWGYRHHYRRLREQE
ncbi:hypothetical protein DPSP01_014259 [Paraphaeosphaeria sporulosa]